MALMTRVVSWRRLMSAVATVVLAFATLVASCVSGSATLAQSPPAPSASSPAATGSAAASPAGSPSQAPEASQAVLDAALVAHVPTTIAQGCKVGPPDLFEGSVASEGSLASLVCALDGGVTADYAAFPDAGSMGWAFQLSLADLDIPSGAASCADGPYLGSYARDGRELGEVACWDSDTLAGIMWTDDALGILAVASAPLDLAALDAWWQGAGPLP